MTPKKHAWQARAEEMARFTLDHLVARADGFGRSIDGRWTTVKTGLQMQDLIGHFKGESTIGIHPLGTDGRVRFLAVDVDAHDDDELRAKVDADAVRRRLAELGLAFLEEDSDGRGGRHFWVRFETPLARDEANRLRQRIKSAVGESLEVFPKGGIKAEGRFAGGFIRLPGKHHTRPHLSSFFVDGRNLVGDEAVEAWINLPANSMEVESRNVTEEGRRGQKTQKSAEGNGSAQTRTEEAEEAEADGRHVLRAPPSSSVTSINEHACKIRAIIDATSPSTFGERNAQVFRLAQRLKGIPGFKEIRVREMKPVVGEWHQKHLGRIQTKPFEETWADFCRAWDRVKFPCDPNRLENAFKDPAAPEVDSIMKNQGYESIRLRRLLSACLRLAQSEDDGVFFLACRTASEYLGFSHRTSADLLHMLVADEVLTLVERGRPPRHASRYMISSDTRLALEASND
ncbi:hypothetical protein OAF82_00360 [bacterium]|nr:hypothetical protein [bacterium]